MAATQVARNNSFTGFDEFVNMPGSPNLQPCARTVSVTAPSAGTSSCSVTHSAFNMRKVGLDESQPPPPPGSSPEILFRYYLAVELRKAGTQPNEALLDRYVRNHFDSLFKNKSATTQSQASSPQTQPQSPVSTTPVVLGTQPVPTKLVTVASSSPAVAATSTSRASTSVREGGSPSELDTAESPAFSGRSHSSIATPVLEAFAEEGHIDFEGAFNHPVTTLLQGSNLNSDTPVKFESGADQTLSFFRTSPFRLTNFESATIDPHVVENTSGAEPFSMARSMVNTAAAVSAAPVAHSTRHTESATPMSEDGLSDQEGQGQDGYLHHEDVSDSESGSPSRNSGGMNRPLSTIPMAVGSINYLKPDPVEYKKLSSKEKRQLRNKISARNFRTRRKEYITQLEEQLADRDTIIEGLRQQLSQMTVENKSLKEEVRIIKSRTISSQDVSKILEALQNMAPLNTTLQGAAATGTCGRSSPTALSSSFDYHTGVGGPATPSEFVNFLNTSRPSTPTLAVPSSPRSSSPRPFLARRSSPSLLPQANTKKDVAPSSSFWGGVGNAANGNNFMPVC